RGGERVPESPTTSRPPPPRAVGTSGGARCTVTANADGRGSTRSDPVTHFHLGDGTRRRGGVARTGAGGADRVPSGDSAVGEFFHGWICGARRGHAGGGGAECRRAGGGGGAAFSGDRGWRGGAGLHGRAAAAAGGCRRPR